MVFIQKMFPTCEKTIVKGEIKVISSDNTLFLIITI